MINVVVLGGSGMLGSMVTDVLSRDPELTIKATVRSKEYLSPFSLKIPNVEWVYLDVEYPNRDKIQKNLGNANWVINAIGLTKPYTHDDKPKEIERAIRINAILPYELSHAASSIGTQILQIATDCVYDGVLGKYIENSPHNPLDVYGKTKSLGEALLPNYHCFRCSIIGPEPKAFVFLLEWFRRQPDDAQINGFINHQWNGVTTLHFAKLCLASVKNNLDLPNIQHIVPTGSISKYDLLTCFAKDYHREDIDIKPTEANTVIDRTLATANETLNRQLWSFAGYPDPPTVPQMVTEMAQFNFRSEGIENK